jgi:type IV pilus assembly protein PilB
MIHQITQRNKLQGIGQMLVAENLIEKEAALEYFDKAVENGVSFVDYLVSEQIITSLNIAHIVAKNFGVPLLDLDCIDIESIPFNLINEKLIKRYHILPLFNKGNHLYLATEDPSKQSALKEIQFHTGLHSNPIVVEADKLNSFIERVIKEKESEGLNEYVDDAGDLDSLEISSEEDEDQDIDKEAASEDAPVVRFVNKILVDAIKNGVSDIHFEPYERSYRIRYRQDGLLNEVASPPVNLANRIASRIKVMSNLDISERRVPQDGRFKMKISKTRSIDFRVSTCPTVGGEKVVMRILDPGSVKIGIEALGFNKTQEENFLKNIQRPQGMILVTGPTGSGKTVTLYTALSILNTTERNISTAEDPVEIKVNGINQVNINTKAGLHFSDALRSFLRQDPDIIMVGEIRDLETAEIAIKAAQTGHLVLSTLHTNSAAETLTRLVNMGVPSFNIASSVSLIIAQRLARRLCEQCKEVRDDITREGMLDIGFDEEDADKEIYKAVGCAHCTNGYRGRLGLFEVMPMSKEIGKLIMTGGNSLDILKQGEAEGMLTIFRAGLKKIIEGITTIEEVNRVTID